MSSDANAAAQLVRVAADNPEAELEKVLRTMPSIARECLLAVDFHFREYWDDETDTVALTALFHIGAQPAAICIAVLRTGQFDQCEKHWRERSSGLSDLVRMLPVSLLPLDGAMPLQPIAIPKPWGREIWYTGIEKRGVAEIGAPGRSVPLPWLLAAAPQRLTRGAQQPILLKILDPLPEPVFGDLYFELHRQKQEVYVVTAIDRQAWPDGVGGIRFGFDAQQRRQHTDDAAFIDAYLQAVRAYRAVREQIDAHIDRLRARDGVDLNAPVAADQLQAWLRETDSALQAREVELRARMDSFTALLPLRVGDVVKVPCLLPHSLQHGVRTVEFQTPVYERLILSFAQKVLTQADWDTEEAARAMSLDSAAAEVFPALAQGEGWKVERIVRFDDFEVRRITLQPRARMQLDHQCAYGLGMVVGQALSLGEERLRPDDAVLLPTVFQPVPLCNDSGEIAYFLLALPVV